MVVSCALLVSPPFSPFSADFRTTNHSTNSRPNNPRLSGRIRNFYFPEAKSRWGNEVKRGSERLYGFRGTLVNLDTAKLRGFRNRNNGNGASKEGKREWEGIVERKRGTENRSSTCQCYIAAASWSPLKGPIKNALSSRKAFPFALTPRPSLRTSFLSDFPEPINFGTSFKCTTSEPIFSKTRVHTASAGGAPNAGSGAGDASATGSGTGNSIVPQAVPTAMNQEGLVGPEVGSERFLSDLNLFASSDELDSDSTDDGEEEGVNMTALVEFFRTKLPAHPRLHRGALANGLRYFILPNRVPPNRFEAHLEMHVGSVDESAHEQGIAHIIEHVAFLGSKKRDKLLSNGARSNAYTDFHHTVFHVHAPVAIQGTEEPMLPMVLDALHEIAFGPRFNSSRIEKERKAVLSELQMMNSIEYRVDCQLLQNLHSENLLSQRFPIGREELIQKWDADTIRAFHERWYFPANATLYLVGDFSSVSKTVEQIELFFGCVPPGVVYPPSPHPSNLSPASSHSPPLPPSSSSPSSNSPASSSHPSSPPLSPLQSPIPSSPASIPPLPSPVRKERHAVRPPVLHRWSRPRSSREEREMEMLLGIALPKENGHFVGEVSTGVDSAFGGLLPQASLPLEETPKIFQHELLQNFSLTIFCKNPVRPIRTYGALRSVLMQRVCLSALQFRINTKYKTSSPPFLSIDLDHSDSGRESCVVSTFSVTAEPDRWKEAVRVGVSEVRRLREFGVTRGELSRYLNALLKDSEQLAAMVENIPSVDNLDFVMENEALGHTIMDQEQAHVCLNQVAETITLEDVNACTDIFDFIALYGQKDAPLPAAIVVSVPEKTKSMPEYDPNRDPETNGASSVVVERAFRITPDEIHATILEGLSLPVEPEPEVEVPTSLLPSSYVKSLVASSMPRFIPFSETYDFHEKENNSKKGKPAQSGTRRYDEATGIIQRRLSNGIRINMKLTENEARGGVLRLVVPGGRSLEDPKRGGGVVLGVRTMSEGGTVGKYEREQVELFCVGNMIKCVLEADEEFICLDFHFTMRHDGLKATLQLIHLILQDSVWIEDAFSRAKQLYLSHFFSMSKSLERITAHTLMQEMFEGDMRVIEPSPECINSFSLEEVKDNVLRQLLQGNMEVSLVGDFSEEEVEAPLLKYLGTISFPSQYFSRTLLTESNASGNFSGGAAVDQRKGSGRATNGEERREGGGGEKMFFSSKILENEVPVAIRTNNDLSKHRLRVSIRDTDERACAYIAGPAPNRWGLCADGRDVNVVVEPLPPGMEEKLESGDNSGPFGRILNSVFGNSEASKSLAPLGVKILTKKDADGKKRKFWMRRRHPLFASVSMLLLTEIINARLFTSVRDVLGLTYDVSFEFSSFDRLRAGWFVVSVTSTPAKIDQAVEASLNVLKGTMANRITQRELDRAKRTLLMRHESDLKDNGYWLSLLTHLQCDQVPRKDVDCIRDMTHLYEVASVDDMYTVLHHLSLGEREYYVCVGTAGGGGAEEGEGGEGEGAVGGVEDGVSILPPTHGRGASMVTRPTV